MANGSQTEYIEYVTADTQVTVDDFREEWPGDLHREMASSRLASQTSVQKMTSFLGTMLIRRSNIISTFLKSDPESVIERSKVEIDFFTCKLATVLDRMRDIPRSNGLWKA